MNITKSLQIIALSIVGVAISGHCQSFLTNGLIAYYPFSGNVGDASGNGNDGINQGAVPVPDRFGTAGTAYQFNGSNAVITIPSLTSISLPELTLAVWVKPFAGPAQWDTIMSKYRGYSYSLEDFHFWLETDLRVGFSNGRRGSGYYDLPNHCAITTTSQLSPGQWSHLVATLDSAGTGTIWVNGILSARDNILPLLPVGTEPVRIGQLLLSAAPPFNGAIGGTFNGVIDDVRIYNRALSSNEVVQLYANESSSCAPVPSGLVSWWRGEGTATDQVGGNLGTPYGNVSYGAGHVGQAFVFDGAGDGIALGNPSNLQLQDFTIETWIQRASTTATSADGNGNGTIFAYGYGGYGVYLDPSGRPALTHVGIDNVTSATAIMDTGFHHLAVTKSGSLVVLYIDGQQNGVFSYNPSFSFTTQAGIGGIVNAQAYTFLGTIDEVSVYNRSLSAAEIQGIYSAGSSGKCLPTNCNPATAVPEVVNGFVVGATVTFGGCGYTDTPLVLFQGGGGHGAAAEAVVNNGVVEDIIITDAGIGYTNPPTILIGFPPSIADQPQSVTVNNGDTASFSVRLANPTPVSYQWLFNGSKISGATASTLTISNVAQTNLGSYSVALSSPFGNTNSTSAILSMYPFLAGPFGGAVTLWGTPVTLGVQAGGSERLVYQWFQNGVAVPGATNALLHFDQIQFTNAGLYSVIVSNPYGSVTNAPAQVVVNPAGVSFGLYPGITVRGVAGYSYAIQRTTDLSDTNAWLTMTNLTLTQPVELWVDTSVDASLPANAHHFYRVLPGQ